MAAEEFVNKDMRGSRFQNVNLSGARFDNLLMRDVRISGAWMANAVIETELDGPLIVNGVDVMPFVEAELNARHPGRETVFAVRTGGADAFRAAWVLDRDAWDTTVARARRLPEEKLHERVDGEWSFIQTLRHLVFATESWVLRTMDGEPSPYHPLSLPFTELGDLPGIPNDVEARPSLDEVLALRADRTAVVTSVIEALTDEQLEERTEPVSGTGFPPSRSFPVRECLKTVLIEEWEHHLFANRDLAVLEASA